MLVIFSHSTRSLTFSGFILLLLSLSAGRSSAFEGKRHRACTQIYLIHQSTLYLWKAFLRNNTSSSNKTLNTNSRSHKIPERQNCRIRAVLMVITETKVSVQYLVGHGLWADQNIDNVSSSLFWDYSLTPFISSNTS